ncbi:monofunctional biosynthetic peptidoglycan transglycosylase [Fodinibius halophilus]|nr:monofunctional biosynthetic peptidoglycan transglycosylase [Fodinibius halophilus]
MDDYYSFQQLSREVEETELFKYRSYTAQFGHYLSRLIAGIFLLSIFIVLLLRWIPPPTTSFILQRQYEARQNSQSLDIQYHWISDDEISPHLKMAAISSEDQRFANHWGLDVNSIQKAINEHKQGADLRGASTITQQVAKNLFLWPSRSYLRKGVEAYLALTIELLWSKERILEVYLNIVEFGDGVYGAEAAAQRYFNKSAKQLSKWESAFMVTALPAPKRYNLDNPSEYMLGRSAWVMRYMNYLGNDTYLEKLE